MFSDFFGFDPHMGWKKTARDSGKCTRVLQAENSSIRRFSSPWSGISVLQLQIWRFVLQLVGRNSCRYSASNVFFLEWMGSHMFPTCPTFLKCQHLTLGPWRLLEPQWRSCRRTSKLLGWWIFNSQGVPRSLLWWWGRYYWLKFLSCWVWFRYLLWTVIPWKQGLCTLPAHSFILDFAAFEKSKDIGFELMTPRAGLHYFRYAADPSC